MDERNVLDEDRIQDYIANRLNERDRANVAAYLLAHPEIAGEVDRLRRQNEALKALGQEILDEPVPDRLQMALRRESQTAMPAVRRSRFLETAAAILLFVVGVASGWYGNTVLRPSLSDDDLALASMARAFNLFGDQQRLAVAFPPERNVELAALMARSFEREIAPPDLASLDYRYLGGELLPAARGDIGTFLFERGGKNRVALFFWSTSSPPRKVIELSQQDGIETRFWSSDGYGIAVIGNQANTDIAAIADHLFKLYGSQAPAVP